MNNETDKKGKRIGIILYPSFDTLDVIGAHQVFHYACKFNPGSEVILIGPGKEDLQHPLLAPYRAAAAKAAVKSGEGLELGMDITYKTYLGSGDAYALDVVYVPGAMQTYLPLYFSKKKSDNPFFQLLDKARQQAEVIASVCTGALLLGTAGYLKARRVTTHWQSANLLRQFPGVTVAAGFPRYVVDENIVTGGGISSTIDEALAITTLIFDQDTAEKAQLIMQYNPAPPVHSGDPDAASPRIMFETSKQSELPYEPGFTGLNDHSFLYYLEHGCIPPDTDAASQGVLGTEEGDQPAGAI